MSKFRKSKSKLAVALLGALFCNVNGASAMNSRMNINKTGVKSSQALGVVEGATSDNTSINNSNNNGDGWFRKHKLTLGIGVLSVAAMVALAIVSGRYLSKKDDDPDKDPNLAKDKKKSNDKKINKDENKDKEKEKDSSEGIPANGFATANKNLIDNAFNNCNGASNYRQYFDSVLNAVVAGGLDTALKEHLNNIKGAFSGSLEMKDVICREESGVRGYGVTFIVNNVQYGFVFNNLKYVFTFLNDKKWDPICSGNFN